MVNTTIAEKTIRTYGKAWTTQDSDLILTIFAKGAVYQERSFGKPYIGHDSIKEYWENKVCREQKDIKFKLLNCYIAGNIVVAEYDVRFFNNKKQLPVHIKEVGIFEFSGNKVRSLREYWHVKKA